MAIIQRYRRKFIEYIRQTIGDPDGIIFTDDEMKSFIETFMYTSISSHTASANNSRYRITPCCISYPDCGCAIGIYLLEVTSGVDESVYILDEQAGWVIFDPDDPANTAVAPVDGTTIIVQYYTVNVCFLLSALFKTMSSNHTKLTLAFSIMGTNQDLKELSDAFWKQSLRYAAEGSTS